MHLYLPYLFPRIAVDCTYNLTVITEIVIFQFFLQCRKEIQIASSQIMVVKRMMKAILAQFCRFMLCHLGQEKRNIVITQKVADNEKAKMLMINYRFVTV